jgi:hypothetical protein
MMLARRSTVLLPVLCIAMAGLLCGCDGYSCDEDEIDRDTACEQITESADAMLVSCNLPPFTQALCELDCISLDGIECLPDERVIACQAAILGLRCGLVNVQTIRGLPECYHVFQDLADICADYDDDDDDWDDDWD